ncbi:MAG: acyltransferase, partial [Prevotellaceae bacterium]|nr:acyltransferase [Prevotellaceae bacterium]
MKKNNYFCNSFITYMDNIANTSPSLTPPRRRGTGSCRLEWLDAMRGFTMILVVAYHVMTRSFYVKADASSSMMLLLLFRMPLFFFISGFLSYRSHATWDGHEFSIMLGKKFRIQIIPTIIFFFVAGVLMAGHDKWWYIQTMFHQSTKGGYWFCLVLLYMYVVYYVFEYIVHRFQFTNHMPPPSPPVGEGLVPLQRGEVRGRLITLPILTLWLISLCVAATCYMPSVFPYALTDNHPLNHGWLADTSIIQLMQFFHFFLFGNIVHRCWGTVEKVFEKRGFILAIIIVAFVSSIDYLKLHLLPGDFNVISKLLAMYSLMILVFLFFRYYQESFTKQKRI